MHMLFGEKIKTMLEIRGMTQDELSRRAGVSLSLIKSLANNRRTNTSTDTIEKIAQALGIGADYFYKKERITPLELVENMPLHIRDFILKQEKMDWLELVVELDEAKKNPHLTKQIIDLYDKTIMLEGKPSK